MKHWAMVLVMVLSGLLVGQTASAEVSDRALVTAMQGKVALANSPGRPVTAFVKLRLNDVVFVPAGSTIQITYFSSGRQENWSGESQFVIGESKSAPKKGQPVSIGQVAAALAQQLSSTPGRLIRAPAGMVRLRTSDKVRLAEIDRNYEAHRATQEPGSVLAEIYKLNALAAERAYGPMRSFLMTLQQQRPNDPVIDDLAAHYLLLITHAESPGASASGTESSGAESPPPSNAPAPLQAEPAETPASPSVPERRE